MRASTPLKILATTALTTCLALSAAAHNIDKDRDNLTTHNLSGFTEIEVSGVYKIDVQVGEDFSVTTSGSDKEVKYMDVSVDGDTLILGTKDDKKNWNIGKKEGIYAVVTLPELNSLDVAGIATGHVDDIDSDDFEIHIAGISDVELSGRCGTLDLHIAGMGDLDAEDLQCADVEVNLAGMGEASVYASESIDANVAGMGQLNVYGKPDKVKKSDSFMAKVRMK